MKVTSTIFVLVIGVAIATALALPDPNQAEEQRVSLLDVNDAVSYDHHDSEASVVRKARQNIRWTGVSRGPTVLIGNNYTSKSKCEQDCRNRGDFPRVQFRNGACRCVPPLNRVGEVVFD